MVATRRDDLSVEVINDEMLVFNPARSEATALNRSAALVFEMCDGTNSVESMKGALEAAGLGPSSDDAVWLALGELADADLIELHVARPKSLGRRDLITQFGVGAAALAALPVVETIKAPSAAAQGSPVAPTTSSTTTTTTQATPSPTQSTTTTTQATPAPAVTPSPTQSTTTTTRATPAPAVTPAPAPSITPSPTPSEGFPSPTA